MLPAGAEQLQDAGARLEHVPRLPLKSYAKLQAKAVLPVRNASRPQARARAVAPGQAFSVREFRGGRRRRSSREFVTQEGDIEVMFHVEGGVHDLSYACHLMRPGDTRERARPCSMNV